MKLYHFTAAHMAPSIKRNGLTRGFLVDYRHGNIVLRPDYIWLTTDGSFAAQDWSEGRLITYDRTVVRFTIDVPQWKENQVIDWLEFCSRGCVSSNAAELLNAYGDPASWRLWHGKIPRQWLCEVKEKPVLIAGGVR